MPATRISSALALLGAGVAAIVSQLPGLSFFTSYAPPTFGSATILIGGLTLALFVWVISASSRWTSSGGLGFASIFFSVILAFGYLLILGWVTVPAPLETGVDMRYQIGFGLADFSLTEKAIVQVQSLKGSATPEDLMLMNGAFKPGGPELIWKSWSVLAAAALLGFIFLLSYLLWAFGLACISKKLLHSKRN